MAEFSLRIVASDKVFYGGPSEIVIVPALDGEYGFMAHHDDMVVAMKPGELRFKKPDGTWEYAVVGGGVAQSANNRVTILVDSAERPEDIDEVRAREAMERAQEQLRQKQSIYEYRMSKASLARAVSRLKEKREWISICKSRGAAEKSVASASAGERETPMSVPERCGHGSFSCISGKNG